MWVATQDLRRTAGHPFYARLNQILDKHDFDAKITKMKDGRTHLAHKAEHAVDLETGAIVAVTVQDADEGDTTTSRETLIKAAEQVETVRPDGGGLEEVVGDKGYHSNQSLVDLEGVGVRSYISEPDRGRRNWNKNPETRDAVYRNRRRIRGARGQRLLRLRGGPPGSDATCWPKSYGVTRCRSPFSWV